MEILIAQCSMRSSFEVSAVATKCLPLPIHLPLRAADFTQERVARPAGLEPATSDLEGRCSIHLSYGRLI